MGYLHIDKTICDKCNKEVVTFTSQPAQAEAHESKALCESVWPSAGHTKTLAKGQGEDYNGYTKLTKKAGNEMSWGLVTEQPVPEPTQSIDIGTPALPEPLSTVETLSSPVETTIARWHESQRNQGYWRAQELKLRNEVIKLCFNTGVEEGTEYYELPNNYKLKAVKKTNYKIDSEKVEAVLDTFSDVAAALLVKMEANLSIANYKKLTDEEKSRFNDCLETKPGLPALELVEPIGK